MSAHQYKHAPIIEAVLEFRFEGSADDKFLDEMARKLRSKFPNQEDQKKREFQLAISSGGDLNVDTKIDQTDEQAIKQLTDADGARVVLLSPTTLSVSRFPPYVCFEELNSDADLVWTTAYKLTGVRKLKRLGMRYINRIDLKFDKNGTVKFENYLNLRIKIPQKYESISNYSLVFEFPLPAINCIAKIRSSIGEPALIDHASFYLDIDVIRLKDLPTKKDDIFRLLEKMRQAKNDMFEEFITKRARAIFDAD